MMAVNDGAFARMFKAEMSAYARQALEDDVAGILAGADLFPTVVQRQDAKDRVAKMTDDQVMDVLLAMTPEPCPECGRA